MGKENNRTGAGSRFVGMGCLALLVVFLAASILLPTIRDLALQVFLS